MKETNQNPEIDDTLSNLPYANCLNCGAELKGKYCHVCGQEATSQTPSVSAFILEYFNHAFIWDANFVPTLWNLIRRPGYLTNEFLKGKFVSHEHPLKLNMFLLFVFVTIFALFATQKKLNDSAEYLTRHELAFPDIQMTLLKSDTSYIKKIYESPRDTILLSAPLYLTEKFPEIIGNIETKNLTFSAPIAGYSNYVYREIVMEHGAGFVCAEMVSDKGMIYRKHYNCCLSSGNFASAINSRIIVKQM